MSQGEKANAERKTARTTSVIFTFLALLLLFLGATTKYSPLYYVAFLLFIFTGLALVSGARTWSIGAQGEETVAHYLSFLDAPYRVIHDIILPEMRGNIDHVVLGPNGVFAIETKNHKGFITCNGDSWLQHKVGQGGTPYLGNIGCPSKQVKRYAILLKNIIQDKLNINLYVNGILVFTNREAKLRMNNPTVIILKPNQLCNFIKTHQSEAALSEEELAELEALIRPHSQFH